MIRFEDERPGGRSLFSSAELEQPADALDDVGGSGEPVEAEQSGIQIKHDSNDLNKGTGIRI